MDKDNLQQQEAPLKNTDRAFVQVGEHGEPVVPATDRNAVEEERESQQAGPLSEEA